MSGFLFPLFHLANFYSDRKFQHRCCLVASVKFLGAAGLGSLLTPVTALISWIGVLSFLLNCLSLRPKVVLLSRDTRNLNTAPRT